ncbi:MAG: hypothetical protein WD342_18540 [Verrucomicrobiales bacterium]
MARDGFGDVFFGYLDINLGYELGDDWAVEVGYRWQAQKLGDDWSHRHVLVTGLLLFF